MLNYYVIVEKEKITISNPFRKDVIITRHNFLKFIDRKDVRNIVHPLDKYAFDIFEPLSELIKVNRI